MPFDGCINGKHLYRQNFLDVSGQIAVVILAPCDNINVFLGITGNSYDKRVTLVYLYHVNRWDTHKKLSIAKLDSVQVCGLSLNFCNNTLRKFYKFSDSRQT